MKKILLALSLVLLSLTFMGCKKDRTSPDLADSLKGRLVVSPAPPAATIATVTPRSGAPNTLVTITGTNFGNSLAVVTVYFNGVKAQVQSVSPIEIKVLVPVTTSGDLSVFIAGHLAPAGNFTYIFPELAAAYVSGDVTLHSQAEVDRFVELNKGRHLQLDGSLFIGAANLVTQQSNDISSLAGLSIVSSVANEVFFYKVNIPEAAFLNNLTKVLDIAIYSCGFQRLSFDQLGAFNGSLTLSDLKSLKSVSLRFAPDIGGISLSQCPLLSDLSFLSPVVSLVHLSLNGLGASEIVMDNLTTERLILSITGNPNLTTLSFKSLSRLGDMSRTPPFPGAMTISYCPLLSSINFKALTTLSGKLTLRGVNLADMSGFSSLQSLGALLLDSNPALTSLNGLEQLTQFTLPAISASNSASLISRGNGIYLSNNARLSSLSGLQQVVSVPIIYINANPQLTELCPLRVPIQALSAAAPYSFTYRDQLDRTQTGSVPALTLTNNAIAATTAAALSALTDCR